ncbi:luciferin sulfotransferase-like isoform X2 [Diorhabda sublineata]|uniref:luciferin sulfotransferase-like isoform X2 n=1 Tax=Diorhabda sublineata TaxID=1163346 RepID=UPI0024E122EC|nr:luciferin sulfotransferase-like isoform X2 [Diorhabda sublineata]
MVECNEKEELTFLFLPLTIIYCLRDPKDTCVSFYYHVKLLHNFNVDFETFCELFTNGAVIYGDQIEHSLEFWNKKNEDNIFIVHYEDMKLDTKKFIRNLADFLGKKVSDAEIEALNDFLQFSKMRKNRSCNCEVLVNKKGGKDYFDKLGYHFIRKGEVGDWKNHMSNEIVKKFDDWIKQKTVGTDFITR